jgi:hypothetical protein
LMSYLSHYFVKAKSSISKEIYLTVQYQEYSKL